MILHHIHSPLGKKISPTFNGIIGFSCKEYFILIRFDKETTPMDFFSIMYIPACPVNAGRKTEIVKELG